jgi:hypothetical protein
MTSIVYERFFAKMLSWVSWESIMGGLFAVMEVAADPIAVERAFEQLRRCPGPLVGLPW